MSVEIYPICLGFEYHVRLAVSIPLAWAAFLRTVAQHHYDYKCRLSAKNGIVNGLYNTAYDSEFPSSFSVGWADLDLLEKIMEQAHWYACPEQVEIVEIGAWISQAKTWISEREVLLVQWSAEQNKLSGVPLSPEG